MLVYGVVIALTLFVYLFANDLHYTKREVDRITIVFFFTAYLLLLCLRDYSVGVDTYGYVEEYEYTRLLGWGAAMDYGDEEIGFKIFRMIVQCFGGARLFVSIAAILIVVPVMYLYQKEAEGAIICVSFFLISLLFEMFFSGMRQSIAIALGVPAYYCVKKNLKIKYLLIIALACSFHRSAVVLLLLYPTYHLRITKRWLWAIIPSMAFIVWQRDLLLGWIFQLAGEEYTYKYSYLTGDSGQVKLMILFMMISIYGYVVLDEKKAGKEDIGPRNILLLATCIHLFTPLHPTISRINYYFILFIPVAISRINNRCTKQMCELRTIATAVMPMFFIFYFFVLKGDSLNVMDYRFFFL